MHGRKVNSDAIIADHIYLESEIADKGIGNADTVISANGSIGTVKTNSGDIKGSVTSVNSFIENVTATTGSINASLSAKTEIGPVWQCDVTGTINAATVYQVGQNRRYPANITSQKSIGNVTAVVTSPALLPLVPVRRCPVSAIWGLLLRCVCGEFLATLLPTQVLRASWLLAK